MLVKYISFLFIQLPVFIFKKLPSNFFHYYKNMVREIDYRMGVSLNLSLFFTPLYGDSHWSLRLVGVLYRCFKILIGLFSLLIFTSFWIGLMFVVLFGPFIALFYSFSLFLLITLMYYIFYLSYYYFNPYEILDYTKTNYSFFDIYKMADRDTRVMLSDILVGKDLLKYSEKLASFLELESDQIKDFINIKKVDESGVCGSIISFGKMTDYRHINRDLLVVGIVNFAPDSYKFLQLKKLPDSCLRTFLIINRNSFSLNTAKIWNEDYDSKYTFPYNAARLDKGTPNLNKYSLSFNPKTTDYAISYLKSFKSYKLAMTNALNDGNKKILVLGESGVGKTTLVEDFYNDIKHGRAGKHLKFNRIVSVDMSNIVSLGLQGPEVLSFILKEFSTLKNTILFLDNLHILYSVEGLDYMGIVLPFFEDNKLKIICTSDYKTYTQKVKNDSALSNIFTKVKIEEMSGQELYDFLTIKNWGLKKKLTVPAIGFLTRASSQILFESNNPQKSLKIIEQATSSTDKLITQQNLANIIKSNTGVSLGEISKDESEKLTDLESEIMSEVVGQDVAVKEVVNALIRSRGSTDPSSTKPIATFLFAGPTGVGKTELARSLARNYFKGEGKIIRLDMSEFQTPQSINRLIGSDDGSKAGILTEAVKENPFNLLLLDEIEKAANNIHMLFLQVLDEGRLTDSKGVTVSFKNIIIIATTNAGTSGVIEDFTRQLSYENVRERFLQRLKGVFPPEFLNRFTEIILFNPLTVEVFGEVLKIKFEKLKKHYYESHKIVITLDPEFKTYLINQSYSKEWGARSLERVLEKTVSTALSKALITNQIHSGDNVTINQQFITNFS